MFDWSESFMYKTKRIYAIFVLFFSCFLVLSACNSKNTVEEYLYNNNQWNSSKEEIVKNEGKEPDEIKTGEKELLQYADVEYFGHKGITEYILEHNKLQEVYFDISFSEGENMDAIKETFKNILSEMESQYGEASLTASLVRKGEEIESMEEVDYDLENPFGYNAQWYNENEKERERFISLTLYGELKIITISYEKVNK